MTNRRWIGSFVLAGAACLGGPALAQQTPRGPEAGTEAPGAGELVVLKTQFLEQFKAAKWGDAVITFRELERQHPTTRSDRYLFFKFAQAQHNNKDVAGATATLESLLENLQGDHVQALFLLAKIKATGDNQDKERAKELLLQAARAGQYVLRDIAHKDNQAIFKYVQEDPSFILKVMNASKEYQVTGEVATPFANKLRIETGEGPTGPTEGGTGPDQPTQVRLKEIEDRVDRVFEEIVELAKRQALEELVAKFKELRALMAEYDKLSKDGDGGALVRKKLERWESRLEEMGSIILTIRLQVYISEGNAHLRAMTDAIRDEDYDGALARFEQVKELCDSMRAEERDVFHRNAEALFLRAKGLADRALILKRIQQFELRVTGIVVAPADQKDKAIINDRIYQEGDVVYDDSDEEIEGLRVVEISLSTVRFRYEDTEFVRVLKEPTN